MAANEVEHGQVEANGISIHTVSMGNGPLVVFCHGFPESWYSWRHQLPAVAAAGYRAVAIDMRGYGKTSQPAGGRRRTPSAIWSAMSSALSPPSANARRWSSVTTGVRRSPGTRR